jgi:hypothetical protein
VPGQQRARRDEPVAPQRQQPSQRGQHCAGRPSPVPAGRPDAAALPPCAAGSGSPRPWPLCRGPSSTSQPNTRITIR